MARRTLSSLILRLLILAIPLSLFFASEHFFSQANDGELNTVRFRLAMPLPPELAQQYQIPRASEVERVLVTGFFSNWSSDNVKYQMQQTSTYVWEKAITLPTGDSQYKFVIYLQGQSDPIWIADPGNPVTTSDSFGGDNSVVSIPDIPFYQLLVDILTLGTFLFFATYFVLEWLLGFLARKTMRVTSKMLIGTIIIVLISNAVLVFYQVFESRKLVVQGIKDSINMAHLTVRGQGLEFDQLEQQKKALALAIQSFFWPAATRVENEHHSINQITLSDIAIFTPDLSMVHVQSRQQNHQLQNQRAEQAGYRSRHAYFSEGVFGPLILQAQQHAGELQILTASPDDAVIAIETPQTTLSRRFLGFSNLLVPIVEEGIHYGYYAVAIQVKMYGQEIRRIVLVNLILVSLVVVLSFFLLRKVGNNVTNNLNELAAWAKRINQGDLHSTVKIDTNDEIASLADNFSEMQRSLINSFDKIEEQNKQLNRAAFFDLHTDLPNRKKLIYELNDTRGVSIAMLEIVQYQQLHQFLGDQFAQNVMSLCIERMQTLLEQHPRFVLYKTAPNQLCLSTTSTDHRELDQLVKDVIEDINYKPVHIHNVALNVSAVAGICLAEYTYEEEAGIQLDRTATALQHAKQAPNSVTYYRPDMDVAANLEVNLKLIKSIREAIQKGWIEPFYQPIVRTDSGDVSAYECLVRIVQPDGEILSPGDFLPAAKQAGLYQSISKIMFEKVLDALQHNKIAISLNLSPEDIETKATRDILMEQLLTHQAVTKRVTLEITETEQIQNYALITNFITEVKQLGCKIALDDFGAGYSNFAQLMSLNIDYIKVDGSLIRNIDQDQNAQKITRAIVECARSLGVDVVAEYVHNESIYQWVRSLGVTFCQGYYFGKPEPRTQPADGKQQHS